MKAYAVVVALFAGMHAVIAFSPKREVSVLIIYFWAFLAIVGVLGMTWFAIMAYIEWDEWPGGTQG
ncbi:MAG: hypothetical protein ABEJ71_02640, partial [Halodesulfurarchaeum sp.]